jgi:hypothetical protein
MVGCTRQGSRTAAAPAHFREIVDVELRDQD